MEYEKTVQAPLLNADRTLSDEGWARSCLWTYSRKEARTQGLRESDSYFIADKERGFIMLFDFAVNGLKANNKIIFVDTSTGRYAYVLSGKVILRKQSPLPENVDTDSEITFAEYSSTMAAVKRGTKRQLLITAPYIELPDGKVGLKAHIELDRKGHESISAAFAEKDDRTKWALRTIESPLSAEGIIFAGHNPIMLSPSATAAFSYYRSRLSRTTTSAMIIGDRWSITAGEDRYMNAITYDGRIEKLGSMLFTRMGDRWIASEENSRIRIEAVTITGLSDQDKTIEFIRCSGSFERENGEVVEFNDAEGIIYYAGV